VPEDLATLAKFHDWAENDQHWDKEKAKERTKKNIVAPGIVYNFEEPYYMIVLAFLHDGDLVAKPILVVRPVEGLFVRLALEDLNGLEDEEVSMGV